MWTILIAALAVTAGPHVDVQSIGGSSVIGTLESLTRENLVINTADGPQTLSTKDILRVTPTMQAPAPTTAVSAWVELVDGSVLAAALYETTSGQARVKLIGGGEIELPTDAISHVRFGQQDGALSGQWEEILADKAASDLIVVQKDNALDFVEGVLGDVTPETVAFDLDGEMLSVKRSKLAGLVYFHAPRGDSAPPLCDVVDVGGSRLKAESISVIDDQLTVATTAGVTFRRPWSQLARIDLSGDGEVYLSEMDWDPADSKWTPYLALPGQSEATRAFFAPRRNRGFDSSELHLGGKKYAKGLGLYSRTRLSFRLSGKFHRLAAVVGIDDDVGERGNVHLVIQGDGKTLFDTSVSGGEDPVPLDLDINGVRRLSILVDYGEDLDVADHLYLCEARLLK